MAQQARTDMGSLARAFLANSGHASGSVDEDALEATLRATLDGARARWPGISIDELALAATLGERWVPDPDRPGVVDLPAFAVELVLARACTTGDAVAVRAFEHEMFGRVGRVLARMRLSPADIDDLQQEIRAKLLLGGPEHARLAQYQGTGPLAHWVASVAGRDALGLMRKRRPIEPIGDDELLETADDPELVALKSRHAVDFKHAFQAAVAELPARDRAILRAMIVDDRTVNEIAAVYGIHRVTASRWVADIRVALLKDTRARLRDRLQLDAASLDSALRLIDTNLDVSLYRLLHGAR